MTSPNPPMPRRLRLSAGLVAAGLAAAAGTLLAPPHPAAFMAFLVAAGLTATGALLFLWGLWRMAPG